MAITSAAFSPGGTKLAFSRAGRVSNVWRVPVLSNRPATWTDATRVTSEHAYIEFVDVSPNGQQLAVSSDRRGNQDLWVIAATGGEMTQLTDDPTPDWNPRWSPDGKEIAFYAYRSGNRDIWVVPSGGGPARQVTFLPRYDWFPAWSPDGLQIAHQVQVTQGAETWVVPSNGGEPRFVTRGSAGGWSPNGEWLAVAWQGGLSGVRDGRHDAAEPFDSSSCELVAHLWERPVDLLQRCRGTTRRPWVLEAICCDRSGLPTDQTHRSTGTGRLRVLN